MTSYAATSVLWTKIWGTNPDSNESIAKAIIKATIENDVNLGRLTYTEQDILELFESAYARAGSTAPANKAKLTWSNYAHPDKEAWFV
jgi:hypothetical protein